MLVEIYSKSFEVEQKVGLENFNTTYELFDPWPTNGLTSIT